MHGNAGYFADEFDIEYIRRKYESMLVTRRQKFEKLSEDDMEAIGKCFALVGKSEIAEIDKLNASLKLLLRRPKRYGEMIDIETNLAKLARLLKGTGLPAMEEIAVLMKYTDKYT